MTPRKPSASTRRRTPSRARLEAMIEEATVDCYNDGEAIGGMFCCIEEHLQMPFDTLILGVPVRVVKVDMTDAGEIVAICVSGKYRQAVSLLELPLPSPPPRGAEWIAAWRELRSNMG